MEPLASVIVIHGFTGRPNKAWRPWLKQELLDRGVAVAIPAMPEPDEPHETAWLDTIDQAIEGATTPIILIGHSLGGLAILRWLETRAKGPIHAIIEVAGLITPGNYPNYNFFERFHVPKDWERIQHMARHRIGIYSEDDPAVPMIEGDKYERLASAQMLRVDGYGHFSDDSHVTKVPELLQIIDNLIQLAK